MTKTVAGKKGSLALKPLCKSSQETVLPSLPALQERKDGLMRDLSAPTRKRLAALGAVRVRSSSRSAGDDLERGEELSSGEVPPLRAQFGGSPQASGEVALDEGGDTFDSGALELTPGSQLQQRSVGGVRGWEGLSTDPRQLSVGSRTGSAVRFVSHVRSESGSQYPLH